MNLFSKIILITSSSLSLFGLTACDNDSKDNGAAWSSKSPFGTLPPGFDGFAERWNKKTVHSLNSQIESAQEEVRSLHEQYAKAETAKEKESIEKHLNELNEQIDHLNLRLKEGDYIKFKKPEDIPTNLTWEDGMDNPEIGDPNAKKGGTIRLLAAGSYPDTFRPFGPNSNGGFRGYLYDEINIGLVSLHPETRQVIPGLAKSWAIGEDNRTVYFKLDPDAKYSDGAPVKAIDFIVNMFLRTSEHTGDIFFNSLYENMASNITIYDDETISITLPKQKPLLPYYCTVFTVSPPHFYSEFGANFVEKYQWRVPPTTGAYRVNPNGVIRGRQISLQRVPNWWAKDKKFTKNQFNVDNIIYNFISDQSKAQELFRIGEIDLMNLTKPELWHERMEIPEVHDGYINRATFYNIYPRPPFGFFLNTSKPPFNNKDIRIGFHHALNIQNVIDVTFRGDYQRLNAYNSGFGKFTNPNIKAREYSPEKARASFAKAGYTISGPDGILRKPDGTRLTAEISFSNASPSLSAILSKLKEDARKCGLDIILDPLDSTVSFRKAMEKRHQAAFTAWGFTPPHPNNEQGFHSKFAYDDKGNPKVYTNNITCFASKEMDNALEKERDASTDQELQEATYKVQQLIHDEALWVPCWATEFTRLGYWRWVRWPESKTTQFSHPLVFEAQDSYLYWIDEDAKKETLEAKRHGDTFSEVDKLYDQYRFSELKKNQEDKPAK